VGLRLAHFLINHSWRLRFKDAYLFHLSWLKFDHRPLLLRLEVPARSNQHRSPFE